ncbi:MAG: hypothetical protein ACJ71R_05680 [Nitrososphaeraceae archaeon]
MAGRQKNVEQRRCSLCDQNIYVFIQRDILIGISLTITKGVLYTNVQNVISKNIAVIKKCILGMIDF